MSPPDEPFEQPPFEPTHPDGSPILTPEQREALLKDGSFAPLALSSRHVTALVAAAVAQLRAAALTGAPVVLPQDLAPIKDSLTHDEYNAVVPLAFLREAVYAAMRAMGADAEDVDILLRLRPGAASVICERIAGASDDEIERHAADLMGSVFMDDPAPPEPVPEQDRAKVAGAVLQRRRARDRARGEDEARRARGEKGDADGA